MKLSTNPIISIIIPVYNVERYIEDCLTSVKQNMCDFADGEVEAIIVNDGSTDNSAVTAKNFCEINSNFHYLQQENSGLSEARNYGVSQAKGEFVFFLDSDDMLQKGAIKYLFQFSEENKCDICQIGMLYYLDAENSYTSFDVTGFSSNNVLTPEKTMKLLIENLKVKSFACGKLYRRDLIKDVKFQKGRFFEDIYWQPIIIGRCEKYGVIKEPLYIYRQRIDSITGMFSLRKIDLLYGYKFLTEYINEKFPKLFQTSVFAFWKIKRNFDNDLKNSNLKIGYEDQQRLDDLDKYCDIIFPNILKNNIEYRIYNISPKLFYMYDKFHNLSMKLVSTLNKLS